eukprot:g23827.t1
MFVVPFLETNPMAGNWLRKFLLLNVLIPCYWFAGLSKLRYCGLLHNLSGAWIYGPLHGERDHSLVTGLTAWVLGQPGIWGLKVPWTCMLLSWGNFLVEIVLPVAAMLSMTEGPVQRKMRFTFLIGAALEVVTLLFALHVVYPMQVYLVRGNHEFRDMSENMGDLGFLFHCQSRMKKRWRSVFEAVHTAFDWMPLGAVVAGKVLVLHGGLGDGTWGLNDLEHIKRPMQDRFTISGSKSMSSAQIRK